jgi:hypothetical protein
MEHLERKILICECHSLQHQVAIWWDDEAKEMYIEPHLSTAKNFFQRIVVAVKYIFAVHRNQWDECIVSQKDLEMLKEHLNEKL